MRCSQAVLLALWLVPAIVCGGAAAASVEVGSDVELLRALQRHDVDDVVVTRAIKLGAAWARLERPVALDRSVTIRSDGTMVGNERWAVATAGRMRDVS
jgi:hypothetical protein